MLSTSNLLLMFFAFVFVAIWYIGKCLKDGNRK